MVNFIPETHQYFTESGKELISVTNLMQKHGLSPKYEDVDPELDKKKAERGTLIHKEIENRIKEGTESILPEVDNFVSYMKSERVPMCKIISEQIAYNDIVAGTVDLLYTLENEEVIIADIKTTYDIHRDSVSWQVSIYNALLGYKANRAKCLHFDKNGSLKAIDIPLKPKAEIEKLFECERNGEIYKRDFSLIVRDNQLAELLDAEAIIVAAKQRIEEAEAIKKRISEAVLKAMEENAVTSFSTDKLNFTYVSGYEKSTFDTKRFKSAHPDEYEKWSKKTTVAPTVKITLR